MYGANLQNSKKGSSNTNSKTNVLSNKALAYLNSKKATSILKSYEEAVSSTKFMNSAIGKSIIKRLENSSSNANFNNERGYVVDIFFIPYYLDDHSKNQEVQE
jgi:hypothetical protein